MLRDFFAFNWFGRLLSLFGIRFSRWPTMREQIAIACVLGVLGWVGLAVVKWIPTPLERLWNFVSQTNALPRADPKAALVILVTKLQGDESSSQTRHLLASLRTALEPDLRGRHIQVIATQRILAEPSAGDIIQNRQGAEKVGQSWLDDSKADILIWGEVAKPDQVIRIYFSLRDDQQKLDKNYVLTNHLELPIEFGEDLGLVMAASITAIAYGCLCDETKTHRAELLRAAYTRLLAVNASPLTRQGAAACFIEIAIGDIAYTFATRGDDTANFGKAASAYNSVIDNLRCAEDTNIIARAWRNLGFTYFAIGYRGAQADALKAAVGAFREAEKGFTKEKFLPEWAAIQLSLADALSALGGVENNDLILKESVAVEQSVLPYLDPKIVSAQWSRARFGLGFALLRLAALQEGSADLEEGINAMREAVIRWPAKEEPLGLSEAKGLLAFMLWQIGSRDQNAARIEEAAAIYKETIDKWPRGDDETLFNVRKNYGGALNHLGTLTRNSDWFQQAVAVHRTTIGLVSKRDVPEQWADVNSRLAEALVNFGDSANDDSALKDAVSIYREVLSVWTRDSSPDQWASSQQNLGYVLAQLGKNENDAEYLKDAAAAFRESLKEITAQTAKREWLEIHESLADALSSVGRLNKDRAALEDSVVTLRELLTGFSRDEDAINWATVQNNIGVLLMTIGEWKQSASEYREAMSCFRASMEIFEKEKNAEVVADLSRHLKEAEEKSESLDRLKR